MIESCFAIIFLCLLFMGLFQLVHVCVSREILYHAAARAARAKTVGFNQWMVQKTMRVAAIPNAGSLSQPVISMVDPALVTALATLSPGDLWDFAMKSTPQSVTVNTELARIPEYLNSENMPTADNILNYENWNTIVGPTIASSASVVLDPSGPGTFSAKVEQPYKLLISLWGLVTGESSDLQADPGHIHLVQHYDIEAQYPLYIEDGYW